MKIITVANPCKLSLIPSLCCDVTDDLSLGCTSQMAELLHLKPIRLHVGTSPPAVLPLASASRVSSRSYVEALTLAMGQAVSHSCDTRERNQLMVTSHCVGSVRPRSFPVSMGTIFVIQIFLFIYSVSAMLLYWLGGTSPDLQRGKYSMQAAAWLHAELS